jgi:hypothetical protein
MNRARTKELVQGPGIVQGAAHVQQLRMHHLRIDPSPPALRSPLSPRERVGILIFIPLQGERGDRKAGGEGSLSTQSTLTEPWELV